MKPAYIAIVVALLLGTLSATYAEEVKNSNPDQITSGTAQEIARQKARLEAAAKRAEANRPEIIVQVTDGKDDSKGDLYALTSDQAKALEAALIKAAPEKEGDLGSEESLKQVVAVVQKGTLINPKEIREQSTEATPANGYWIGGGGYYDPYCYNNYYTNSYSTYGYAGGYGYGGGYGYAGGYGYGYGGGGYAYAGGGYGYRGGYGVAGGYGYRGYGGGFGVRAGYYRGPNGGGFAYAGVGYRGYRGWGFRGGAVWGYRGARVAHY